MRVENTIRNAKYNFPLYFVSIILGFVSRSFFLRILGVDLLGVNGVIGNLIGFLQVAEMGISVAITYSLFKPLSERDDKKINEIMILFKHYYKRISIIVLVTGLIVSIFLKFFIKSGISDSSMYLYYYLFLFNTVITYLFSYKQTLIIADQKQYVITLSTNITKLIKVIIQIAMLMILESYIIWIILEIVFNFINLVYLSKKCDKIYNKIDFKKSYDIQRIKSENPRIVKDIKNIFLHKMANFVLSQTDGLLISFFLSLRDVGIYGSYVLITSSIAGLFTTVINSVTASIGNMIIESKVERVYSLFKKMYLMENYLALIISYTLYYIINLFMELWLGKGFDFSMEIIFVLMINLYIQISRPTVDRFRNNYGIFWDIYAPVVEGGLNLIISILLIEKMGIVGVLIGTLVSNIVVIILWKPYTLYKCGFKMKTKSYVIMLIKIVATAISSILISNYIRGFFMNLIGNDYNIIVNFIINAFVTGVIITVVATLINLLQKDFRELVRYVLKIVLKR